MWFSFRWRYWLLAEYIITYIKPYLEEFDYVYGIPSGGVRLAASLNNKLNLTFNQDSEMERILIADDVYILLDNPLY